MPIHKSLVRRIRALILLPILTTTKYMEYCRVVRALANQSTCLEEAGANFLKEILTGVSHAARFE